ncbi:hypothetical protein [Vandammella animalimorsus]|uniref:hypothetical protein n=1 Tax=Vandammella animalimorsus TaxID=2029117 RepID=UPI0011C42D96|nr:hypothetical protein [Vandammella animalimorsus]
MADQYELVHGAGLWGCGGEKRGNASAPDKRPWAMGVHQQNKKPAILKPVVQSRCPCCGRASATRRQGLLRWSVAAVFSVKKTASQTQSQQPLGKAQRLPMPLGALVLMTRSKMRAFAFFHSP